MKQQERWVLVANATSARIFRMENLHKLTELKSFVHPEGRMHDNDLVSDQPGRDFASTGNRRHALEQKTSPKDVENAHFARQISNYLDTERKNSSFSELFVIAAPSFLGILRQTFHPSLQALIQKEVNKDVVRLSTAEILSQINE